MKDFLIPGEDSFDSEPEILQIDEFKKLIKEGVISAFQELGLSNNISTITKYVTLSEGCKELGISRQTFSSWKKMKHQEAVVKPFIKMNGKRISIEIEGLKRAIKDFPEFFRIKIKQ